MELVYISVSLQGSEYYLLVQEQGQPTPKKYKLQKKQIASVMSGLCWALYEDLAK